MQKAVIGMLESGNSIYHKFGNSLTSCGHSVHRLVPSSDPSAQVRECGCDVVIAADPLNGVTAIELLNSLHQQQINCPVVFIAAHASVRCAVDAIHWGASDYLLASDEPLLLHKCIDNLLNAGDKNKSGHDAAPPATAIVTTCPAMRQMLEMARRIAPSAATVLIQGESGTGKELLARYIHSLSGRPDNGFVAMNCAALPDTLAESELFGYERGAFTGAVQRKSGKFELAHNGTLLLDEISEMPLALQAKLLRVLQEKEVDRIGGQKAVRVDVRVIATTNLDLGQMVSEGRFRKDLFYRLRVIPISIPALRDRKEDISALVDHFLKKHSAPGEPLPVFTRDAMEKILNWDWPGNVRELENTVERAVLIRNGSRMGPETLLLDDALQAEDHETAAQLVGLTVKELEERLIRQTLQHVNQNRTHAAEMLGISIRTLRNKLREYQEDGEPVEAAGEGGG